MRAQTTRTPAERASAVFEGRSFRDFVLDVGVGKPEGRNGFAGVAFRQGLKASFEFGGRLLLSADRPGAWSYRAIEQFHSEEVRRLKVVCIGPIVRIRVNGKIVLEHHDPDHDVAGAVELIADPGHVGFEDPRISTKVPPREAVIVEPLAEDDCLLFAPDRPVALRFRLRSASDEALDVDLGVVVSTWKGKKALARAAAHASLAPGADQTVSLDLAPLPEGYYRMLVEVSANGAAKQRIEYPLAVHERPSLTHRNPVIPIAPYWKQVTETLKPIVRNTYVRAAAHSLHAHHFNAVVGGHDAFIFDVYPDLVSIFKEYGLATITRSGRCLDKPSVIASLMSDEPKEDTIAQLKAHYEELGKKTHKLFTTNVPGEDILLAMNKWRFLQPKVRLFRWYGVKKSFYGIKHRLYYKGWLDFSDVLNIAETCATTPYWAILPSFGDPQHEGYYMNLPAKEMMAMMHLCLAYGARGILFYTLQTEGSRWSAFVDRRTLQPCDKKYDVVANVAALVGRHADLLAALHRGGFDVLNSNTTNVEAVPRRTEAGKTYVYVVNKDAQERSRARIGFEGRGATRVQDVFSGKHLKAMRTPEGLAEVTVTLRPGEAALLEVDAVVPAAKPIAPLVGSADLEGELAAVVKAKIREAGVAVLSVRMPEVPCIPGDGIGLGRADDPLAVWKQGDADHRCFSWSGLLDGRMAAGYLPLNSALQVAASADAEKAYWTVYPAVGNTRPTPGQLRAMLHLALAHRSKALIVPDDIARPLKEVVDEVSAIATAHGKTIAELKLGGLDVRCKNALVAPIPLQPGNAEAGGRIYIYAVNLDTEDPVTAHLLLWSATWHWSMARDVFANQDLAVSPPDEEGYRSCTVTLKPGEGKLIEVDARQGAKP